MLSVVSAACFMLCLVMGISLPLCLLGPWLEFPRVKLEVVLQWPRKVVGRALGHDIVQDIQVLVGRCVNAQCVCVLCF